MPLLQGLQVGVPGDVDMATYNAEFLSHYYEGRRRPLHAHAFGLIHRWLRGGGRGAAVANALHADAGVPGLVKRVLHVAPDGGSRD